MFGAGSAVVVVCTRRWYVTLEEKVGGLEEIFIVTPKRLPCTTHSDDANIRVAQRDHEAAQS
jgi:hypothetical protein